MIAAVHCYIHYTDNQKSSKEFLSSTVKDNKNPSLNTLTIVTFFCDKLHNGKKFRLKFPFFVFYANLKKRARS